MKPPFGMPGIGGSLGQCALCGENFLMEILMGQKVYPFEIDGIDQTLYAHKACFNKYKGKTDPELPVGSPLRAAVEKARAAKENVK